MISSATARSGTRQKWPAPPAPSRDDPATFEERNNDAVKYQFETLPPAINQTSQARIINAVASQAAATQALGYSHFKGRWGTLTGALSIPATVYYSREYWQLLANLPNVAASEPSLSNPNWAVVVVRLIEPLEVGDYRDPLRPMSVNYLKRDGATHTIAEYPDLAALLPPMPSGYNWEIQQLPSELDVRGIARVFQFELLAIASSPERTEIFKSENDGSSWNVVSVLEGFEGLCIAANPDDGSVVIGGTSRRYTHSGDESVTWPTSANIATLNEATRILRMAFCNGAFFATGKSSPSNLSYIMRSTNRTTWASAFTWSQSSTSNHAQGYAMWASGDRVFAGGIGGSYNQFVQGHAAGTSFTSVSTAIDGLLQGGVYTGDRHVSASWDSPTSGFTIKSSPNWSSRTIRFQEDVGLTWAVRSKASVYASNKLVMPIGDNRVLISDAFGETWEQQLIPDFEHSAVHPTACQGEISLDGAIAVLPGAAGRIARGYVIPPGHFRVPDDNPLAGWVKAKAS